MYALSSKQRKIAESENQSPTEAPPIQETYGIKVLSNPKSPAVDIVFIHGLTGGQTSTWTAENTDTPWPEGLLAQDIPQARISAFGYDADVVKLLGQTSQNRIRQHAHNLLGDLEGLRFDSDTRDLPIIFVAHSLGGLVCENALTISNNAEDRLRRILDCTRAIAFLGTPHRGSELASWANMAGNMVNMAKRTNVDIISTLDPNSEVLATITQDFHTMLKSREEKNMGPINITCYVEELPVSKYGKTFMVVPAKSATLERYSHYTIHANHVNMTKFKNRNAGYLRISRELKRWIQTMKAGLVVIDPQDLPIIRELFVTDPSTDREKIENRKDRLLEGSCSWVLEDETYKEWKGDDRFQTLWIHGEPGKGKTMMAISLVDALSKERTLTPINQTLLAFFFCDNADGNRNNTLGVMKSLLYQIFRQRPDLINEIRQDFQTQRNTFTSLEAVWQILQKIIRNSSVQKIYVIIDALDECEEKSLEAFLSIMKPYTSMELKDLPKNRPCMMKWILTSRSEKRIEEHLRCPGIDLKLNSSQVSQAVERFISFKVNDLAERKDYDKSLKTIIEENLRLKAEGTFLWVALACKELENYEVWDIDPIAALKDLPSGLPQLYDRVMQQIIKNKPKGNVEIAKAILGSVLVAFRPLTLEELAVTANLPRSIRHNPRSLAQCIKKTCGSFLTVPQDTVHFVHQSAKDYLLSLATAKTFSPNLEMENQTVALNCFWYVCNDAFPEHSNGTMQPRDNSHVPESAQPVLEYPVVHWIQHTKTSSPSIADMFDLNEAFFSPISRLRQAWVDSYWHLRPYSKAPQDFTALHLAAYFGLDWLVTNILKMASKVDVNKFDSFKMSPLYWAIRNKYGTIVALLLDNGADIEAKDDDGDTALLRAVYNDNENETIVSLLLERGADVEAKDNYGETALLRAVSNENETIMSLLLEMGADVEAKYNDGGTALLGAVWYSHETIVSLLLEKGADVEAKDDDGRTALLKAVWFGRKTLVSLLLEKGADVEAKDNKGHTALYYAASKGNETILKLLLEKGAKVEATDGNVRLAMSYACSREYKAIQKLLLDHVAQLETREY